jgi:hypothetical protein
MYLLQEQLTAARNSQGQMDMVRQHSSSSPPGGLELPVVGGGMQRNSCIASLVKK